MNIKGPRATITRMLMSRSISGRRSGAFAAKVASRNYSGRLRTNKNSPVSKANNSSMSQTRQIVKYEDMERAAKKLQTNTKDLISKADYLDALNKEKANKAETATEEEKKKIDKSIDDTKKEILSMAKDVVSYFNTMYEKLDEVGGAANLAYVKRLKDITTGNKAALEAVGVSIRNDGTLSVDTKAFEAADIKKITTAFCTKNGLSGQVYEIANAVEKSASTMLKTLDNSYGTSTYNKYAQTSKYYDNPYLSNFSSYI